MDSICDAVDLRKKVLYVTELITEEGSIVMELEKHENSIPTSMQAVLLKYNACFFF